MASAAVEIERVRGDVDAVIQAMRSNHANLVERAHALADHPVDNLFDTGTIEQLLNELQALRPELIEALDPANAVQLTEAAASGGQECAGNAAECLGRANDAHDQLTAAHEQSRQQLQTETEEAEAASGTVDESFSTLSETVKASTATIGEHQSTLTGTLEEGSGTVEQEVGGALEESLSACGTSLQGHREDSVPDLFEQTGERINQLLQSHGAAFGSLGDKLTGEVESFTSDLINNAVHGAQQRFEQVGSELVREIGENLAREITEAVIKTEIGAQITTSMSGIMPQLIVLNKALDTIEEGIRIFNEIKNLGH